MLFLHSAPTVFSLLFFLFFHPGKLHSQNLDSLKTIVSNSSGNKKAEALYKLSIQHISKNDSLALNYINDALLAVDQDDKLLGQLTFHRAMVFRSKENDVYAIRDLKKASEILKPIDTIGTAEAMYWLGRIHRRKGRFPEALHYAFNELELRKLFKDSSLVAASMFDLGYIYDRMGEYNKAIEWHKRGLNYYSFSDNKGIKAWGTGLLGIAYDELGKYDSALFYNKKAIDGFIANDQKDDLKTWYSNVGNTYIKMNDLKNAELYTKKSLAIDMPIQSKSVTLINLGKIYLESGRYRESKVILDSAMALVKKYDQKRFLSEAFYRFHELNKKQNRFSEALEYYVKYKKNEDELLDETKAEQIAELSIQYETTEKEKRILTQRAELAEKELTIQQRTYQMFGLGGLALILGLIGYLFYNQQKLKNEQLQKENELKDALIKIETQNRLQEQRLRISRDLHDNIGSQLTFIISSIDNLKYGFKIDDDKLTNTLDGISTFTKETIYELRDTIWAMNKNEIAFDDLQSRISNFIEKADLASTKTTFSTEIDHNITDEMSFSSVDGMNIYRIIQEAVNNAIKYAEATVIQLKMELRTDTLAISVSDDGKGFVESDVEQGNGIKNMKKRSLELKAGFMIDSKLSKGTTVQLLVPLNT
ncbi:MAG: tetratricopeptide repeat protein [Bacteroidia bacterium]|nr:tetratricopeptide repeat protein [Bacteroidia bacterium]